MGSKPTMGISRSIILNFRPKMKSLKMNIAYSFLFLSDHFLRYLLFFRKGISRKANLIGIKSIVLGKDVRIHPFATVDCRVDPFLGDFSIGKGIVSIGQKSMISSYAMLLSYGGCIKLGENCTVNPYTVLYGAGGLSIGNNTRIACHTVIIPSNHVFSDPNQPIYKQGLEKKGVSIGDDVWIGSNVTILDGVCIGNGCVIGANAVVTKSFPSNSIIVGNPARIVRMRGDISHPFVDLEV